MAVAVSTTCKPLCTSPWASANVFPCSSTIDRAISGVYFRIRCCNLTVSLGFLLLLAHSNITLCRLMILVCDHSS